MEIEFLKRLKFTFKIINLLILYINKNMYLNYRRLASLTDSIFSVLHSNRGIVTVYFIRTLKSDINLV